jgi:peptidoglycan/LPS O-acetylase OafA/YrhL
VLIVSLIVATLTVARVTRLLVDDQLTTGYRRWVIQRWGDLSWQSYLAHCPWCTSIWVALPTMPAAVIWPNKWVVAALAVPAASLVTGLISEIIDRLNRKD